MIGGSIGPPLSVNILCVCTHNYFRSQIAAALLRARGYRNVLSAGTATADLGPPPHPNVLNAISIYGAEARPYSPQSISQQLVEWADMILCAEEEHRAAVLRDFPGCKAELVVMNIPDDGVNNSEAVLDGARQISGFINDKGLFPGRYFI